MCAGITVWSHECIANLKWFSNFHSRASSIIINSFLVPQCHERYYFHTHCLPKITNSTSNGYKFVYIRIRTKVFMACEKESAWKFCSCCMRTQYSAHRSIHIFHIKCCKAIEEYKMLPSCQFIADQIIAHSNTKSRTQCQRITKHYQFQ